MRHGTAGSRTATAWREALGSEKVLTGVGVTAYRLGEVEPVVAVIPRDEADVSRVLALAFEDGAGVVPWGGGAHQSVGAAPTRYDVALDLSRLDRVVAYEPADMTATVQAGARLATLQQRLGEAGQFWPLDPPLADRATVGGVVAANLNGPLRCRYGTVRDMVLGVRVAHADGTITKAGAARREERDGLRPHEAVCRLSWNVGGAARGDASIAAASDRGAGVAAHGGAARAMPRGGDAHPGLSSGAESLGACGSSRRGGLGKPGE